MTKQAEGIDINELDAVSDCEGGYTFDVLGPDGEPQKDRNGNPTGIRLTVIGKHADPVVKWQNAYINRLTSRAAIAARGRKVNPPTQEEQAEDNIEGAAVRVVGWAGVKQAFDRELLKKALRRNPHWVQQIVEASDDLGNFISKPSKS